ncbi:MULTISPECIES: hypothetical protein [Mycobacteroides]|uniref:Secreted protein n=1 Tax=Mycobacteroides chelonae TaxID=1774 RepID=A0A1S1LQK4_MYCCH|nr:MULTISPECIES: hypothetical protein [Mycobacteroides]KRQ25801.1 hypothetical protein AOT87_06355 [Mycobacteroides sp. H003]KRQ36272.1 hypothetical protein AOT91_03315 [Mycobacteroides sp. H092]KRQ39128.1 hypothetical protein AOT92_17545 [Mycobacteroides sp. H101]KRQ48506.1 hypothetical protein AOT88_12355 [Mycobacteroides sp. H063]KRQ58944.1 hypothetical protein AOT94_12030 [Mycobacteroides sp. HXVII]
MREAVHSLTMYRYLVPPVLVVGSLVGAPQATAAPECPTLTDGGAENYANVLHDVRIETLDDLDRVTFSFGPDKLAPPTGPVTYWQAPPFSVTPVSGGYAVAFRGAAAHDTVLGTWDRPENQQVKSFPQPKDLGAPAGAPVVRSARLLQDPDIFKDKNGVMAWKVAAQASKCPVVYIADTPARAVIDFPH